MFLKEREQQIPPNVGDKREKVLSLLRGRTGFEDNEESVWHGTPHSPLENAGAGPSKSRGKTAVILRGSGQVEERHSQIFRGSELYLP